MLKSFGGMVSGDNAIEDLVVVDLSEKERARIQADQWILLTKAGANAVTDEQFDDGFELNLHAADNPEFAWLVFENIIGRYDPDDISSSNPNEAKLILANLGAGPLETFVASNGDKFIDRIAQTNEDVRFQYALSNMWQNATPDPVWHEMQRVLGRG